MQQQEIYFLVGALLNRAGVRPLFWCMAREVLFTSEKYSSLIVQTEKTGNLWL